MNRGAKASGFSKGSLGGAGKNRSNAQCGDGKIHGGSALPVQSDHGIGRAAARLLAALAEGSAYAVADPTEEGWLVVRRFRGGLSLGAGRFPAALAEVLIRHDLAAWEEGAAPNRPQLRMSAAGAAHRKRANAGQEGFREQHGSVALASIAKEHGSERLRVELDESPLDWLRRRRDREGAPFIEAAHFQAGERLRSDITQAGLLPSVTARWDPVRGDGGPRGPADASDRMIGARQRVRHAFDAVGADFSDLLIDLCGFLKGLETIERERRWPPRSAKVVVRLALARLAEHYGLASEAKGPATSRRIRAWQAVVIEGGLPSRQPD